MNKYGARTFKQSDYDQFDQLAKDKFVNYITQQRGHSILSSKESFNHDIVTVKNGVKHYFELEVKVGYPFKDRESFKFNTVSFLGRKKRLHEIEPFQYIIVCYETGWAVGCSSNDIYKDQYTEELKIQKRGRKGLDQFFRIDKDKCYFFNLNQ